MKNSANTEKLPDNLGNPEKAKINDIIELYSIGDKSEILVDKDIHKVTQAGDGFFVLQKMHDPDNIRVINSLSQMFDLRLEIRMAAKADKAETVEKIYETAVMTKLTTAGAEIREEEEKVIEMIRERAMSLLMGMHIPDVGVKHAGAGNMHQTADAVEYARFRASSILT